MSRAALSKAGVLVVILLGGVGLSQTFGTSDIPAMRSRVESAGLWGPALFFAFYSGLALIPCPKAVLTAAGGALFGLWAGAGLSLAGAMVGAIISFGAGRLLGREAVDRLIRGRLARVDALLSRSRPVCRSRGSPGPARALHRHQLRFRAFRSQVPPLSAGQRARDGARQPGVRGAGGLRNQPVGPGRRWLRPGCFGGRWILVGAKTEFSAGERLSSGPNRCLTQPPAGFWVGPCPGWPGSLTDLR